MTREQDFEKVVAGILGRYPDTLLADRWREAELSDPTPRPAAFWIRESEDLINIVWLTDLDIRDITWLPDRGLSTFHLLRLTTIISLETRQAPEAAKGLGLSISGDYLTIAHTPSDRGGLIWVATKDEKNIDQLRSFVGHVIRGMARVDGWRGSPPLESG